MALVPHHRCQEKLCPNHLFCHHSKRFAPSLNCSSKTGKECYFHSKKPNRRKLVADIVFNWKIGDFCFCERTGYFTKTVISTFWKIYKKICAELSKFNASVWILFSNCLEISIDAYYLHIVCHDQHLPDSVLRKVHNLKARNDRNGFNFIYAQIELPKLEAAL